MKGWRSYPWIESYVAAILVEAGIAEYHPDRNRPEVGIKIRLRTPSCSVRGLFRWVASIIATPLKM